MGRKSKEEKRLERKERTDLLKSIGRGFIEFNKSSKVASYATTSLILLALGKLKIISPAVCGTLQGVNTYIAISEQVEEAGTGFFNVGGGLELAAKGGTATLIGVLWGAEAGGVRGESGDDQTELERKLGLVEKLTIT